MYLTSTQDLLSRFLLLPAYDKYVRPAITAQETGLDVPPTPTLDKGKGREVDTPGDGHDGSDDHDHDHEGGDKGAKKNKNNYKHLIKGIPGAYHSHPT